MSSTHATDGLAVVVVVPSGDDLPALMTTAAGIAAAARLRTLLPTDERPVDVALAT